MLRHAYLIMIHEHTLVLERLLQLLDDERNSIFIHIDKSADSIDVRQIERSLEHSPLHIYKKYKLHWGTGSIARTQIFLLENAVREGYDYYHILSGADLPIKTKQEIWRFFEEHGGKEFIHFGTRQYQKDIRKRYDVYHFFSKQLGRKRDKKFWVDVETYSLAIQRRLHIDRTKKLSFSVYGGANWCSITNGLAEYIAAHYKKYKKAFRWTQNSDELICQTIVMDSPFRKNLYMSGFDDDHRACARYIDWERGAPYVFRMDDLDDLLSSECMFARKFDENVDREIIERLYDILEGRCGGQTDHRN